ncbi:MAG: AAA family ATPase [Nitrososphaera sp.]|jgi:MoxR-like ATPase/predicted RNA-binding protein
MSSLPEPSDKEVDVIESEHDYAPIIKRFLEEKFSVKISKKSRASLELPSGLIVHAKGSAREKPWYGLDETVYDELMGYPDFFLALALGEPGTTFVLPKTKVREIFYGRPTKRRPGRDTERWLFKIIEKDDRFFLKLNNVDTLFDITNYQNEWKQIPELKSGNTQPNSKKWLYVTSDENWVNCVKHNALGSEDNRALKMKMIKAGDKILVYLKGMKLAGIYSVNKEYFHDTTRIWEDDIYPHRIGITPHKVPSRHIEITDLYNNKIKPEKGEARGYFGQTIRELPEDEYRLFESVIEATQTKPIATEIRHWKIAPGEKAEFWPEQRQSGVIAIGWNEVGDLSRKNFDEVQKKIETLWPQAANIIGSQIRNFLSIKIGDIIIANNGISRVVGIGRVTGNYKYRPDLTHHNTLPVDWFDTMERTIPKQEGVWTKTVVPVSKELFDKIVGSTQDTFYLLVRHNPEFKRNKNDRDYWNDILGKEYHYGTTVANHTKVIPGTKTIWFYTDDDSLYFWGHGDIDKVTKIKDNEFVATMKSFRRFDQASAIKATGSVEMKVRSLRGWNPFNSIIEINKEIYEEITGGITQKRIARSWLSITSTELEEIITRILNDNDRKLAIEESVVRRIINHLISGKHVVLVGAPGTGKTDLAKRILKELGSRIRGVSEFVEAVASYEWGRYDVIGGNTLDRDADGKYVFHLGCVTKAIQEDKFLLIDEFNRADMNKAFGEMFLAIDHGRIDLRSDEDPPGIIKNGSSRIWLPNHFRMICTMNDYDKSLLNDLSYGLLRRFAFVEVDIPPRNEIKGVVVERARNELEGIDSKLIDVALGQMDAPIDCFISFVYEIKSKRTLGVSTIIDVVKYLITAKTKGSPSYTDWRILKEAMIDLVLPQFDRLDIETLRHVNLAIDNTMKYDGMTVGDMVLVKNKVDEMIHKLEGLGELFDK